MEAVCYVYEHWRPDKGTCFYVGKPSKLRGIKRDEEFKRKASVAAKVRWAALRPMIESGNWINPNKGRIPTDIARANMRTASVARTDRSRHGSI